MALFWGEGDAESRSRLLDHRSDLSRWQSGPNVFSLYARLEIATRLAILSNYLSNAQWDL